MDAEGRLDLRQLARPRLLAPTAPLYRRLTKIYLRCRWVTRLLEGPEVFQPASIEAEFVVMLDAANVVIAARPELESTLRNWAKSAPDDLPAEARLWVCCRIVEWHLHPIVIAIDRHDLRRSFATICGKRPPSTEGYRPSPARIAELDQLCRDPARWAPMRKPRAGYPERRLPPLAEFIRVPDNLRQPKLTETELAFHTVHSHFVSETEPDTLDKLDEFGEHYPEPGRTDPTGAAFTVKIAARTLAWIDPAEPGALKVVVAYLLSTALHSDDPSDVLDAALCELLIAWAQPLRRPDTKTATFDTALEQIFVDRIALNDAHERFPARQAGQVHAFARQRAFRPAHYDVRARTTMRRWLSENGALHDGADPAVRQLLADARLIGGGELQASPEVTCAKID